MIARLALAAALFASAEPRVGAPAPEFSLPSQDAKPVALKDLRGKWVVLYFYPKDFTRGCTIEARNFQLDQKRYEALGAVIVGVSMQSAKSHKDFCVKESLGFTLLSDEKGEVSKAYDSTMGVGPLTLSERNTFLIAPDGALAKVFRKVSPDKHSAEVLAALGELRAAGRR